MANDPKILLIGLQLKHRSFKGANKALPVLASSLNNAGFRRVTLLDMEIPGESISRACKESEDAGLIAFAGVLSTQLPELDAFSCQLSEHIRRMGKAAPIIAGGYVSKGVADVIPDMPQLSAFFDGEGEEGIVQIARAIAVGRFEQEKAGIRGLCFLENGGGIHSSLARRVKNIDEIDQNFGLIHIPEKHDMEIFGRGGAQRKTMQLFTQRGCAFRCSFCNKSMERQGIVRLGSESFINQLLHGRDKGFGAVYLDDDTFSLNIPAAGRVAEELGRFGMIWGANTRVDLLSEKDAAHFAKNGCVYMFGGVEHSKPEVVLAQNKFNGNIGRQISQAFAFQEKIRCFFKTLQKAGIQCGYFLILGLPKAILDPEKKGIDGYMATTLEDDLEAIEFALGCEPDYLNLNGLRFMPGSEAADIQGHPVYSIVRPSGDEPITAGWFLPRLAKKLGYKLQQNHGIFRLMESLDSNQPLTAVLTPERVDKTFGFAIARINSRIDSGHKATRLFIDEEILKQGLISIDERGRYHKAPLKEFESLGY